MSKNARLFLISFCILISFVAYYFLGYHTAKTDFYQIICLYILLFGGYIYLLFSVKDRSDPSTPLRDRESVVQLRSLSEAETPAEKKQNFPFLYILLAAGILFRILLLFFEPVFSDDWYRFIWDSALVDRSINPYQMFPCEYITNAEPFFQNIYQQLNSQEYYSVYPPVLQVFYYTAAKLSGFNLYWFVVILKTEVLIAELASIYLIIKLLEVFKMPKENVLLYALNPLVIMELTGNLHNEAFMITGLLAAVYLMQKRNAVGAAITFGIAVGAKILPLMFLPFLIKRMTLKQVIVFSGVLFIVLLLCFAPLLNLELAQNFFSSVRLYFQRFEFNASIYYIARWVGFQIAGYNIIQIAGVVMSGMVLAGIIYMFFKDKASEWKMVFTWMLMAISLYYFMSTTVHPWYLSTFIAFTVFTRFRYPLGWSFLIMLSYFTYSNPDFAENDWFITIEYLLVYGLLLFELRKGYLKSDFKAVMN